MDSLSEYVKAASIEEIKESGCLKTAVGGRMIMLCFFEGDFFAMDMGSADNSAVHSIPADNETWYGSFLDDQFGIHGLDWTGSVFHPIILRDDFVFVDPCVP